MLQKLRENSTGWIAKLILLLLAVPFAFFGMEQYLTQRVDTWVAQVEAPPTWWSSAPGWWPVSMLWQSEQIDDDAFRTAFQQARQRQQQVQGEAFDPRAFETAENKRAVLEQLIDARIRKMAAQRADVAIGDAAVRDTIASFPAFQVDGKFNPSLYQRSLAAQVPPRSPLEFQQLIRESLQQSLVTTGVADSAFVSDARFQQIMTLLFERRDIAYVELSQPELSPERMQVSDEQVKAWYQGHTEDFHAPETVAIEYVEIDAGKLPVAEVDEAGLRKLYQQEGARFVEAEQRLASHILVDPEGSDTAAWEQARVEAAKLASQAGKPEADFATLAREHSDDAGSSASGGDLGWVAKGVMGEAFDAALFALQPGQVSEPVKTDFGWHVIKLREVKTGEQVPFEQVKAQLASELATRNRERAYNDLAGRLLDEVYKNPNALAPAARAVELPLQATEAFARGSGKGIAANPAVQREAFSEVRIEDGTVSDPIELGPEHSVVIRVLEHSPERARPLAEVREQVVSAIRAKRIDALAQEQAKAMLAKLAEGATLEELASEHGLSVVKLADVPRGAPVPDAQTHEDVFALPVPQAGEVSAGQARKADGRRVVFVVSKVVPGDVEAVPAEQQTSLRTRLAAMTGDQDAKMLVDAWRQRMRVKVAEDRL